MKVRLIILSVSNIWSPRNGLKDFIELSQKLDPTYQIMLIGLNEAEIKILPANIILLTRTESVRELELYYSSSDVFVNSTWEDNFLTTNLEDLACRTPVITCQSGRSPESIDDNTGFVGR